MDFWCRSVGVSWKDQVRNERILEIIVLEKNIEHDIFTSTLSSMSMCKRVPDDRLLKKFLDWVPDKNVEVAGHFMD